MSDPRVDESAAGDPAESSEGFRLTFPKSHHLRTRDEFSRVYGLKVRASDDVLLVYAAANDLEHSRIGLSVSKKNGNAVARNRVKRLLREAYRLDQHTLPSGLDLILIPRPKTGAGLNEFRRSLRSVARRAEKKCAKRNA